MQGERLRDDPGERLSGLAGAPVPAFLEVMADVSASISFLLDAQGRVGWASARTCALLGMDLDDLAGLPAVAALRGLGEAVNPEALAVRSGPVEVGGEPEPADMLVLLDRTGEQRWFQITRRAVADGGGAADGWSALVMNEVSGLMERLARAERAKAAIEERLNIDAQTGLPNERAALETLGRMLSRPLPGRSLESVGLMLVEILDFREIVDLHGTGAGRDIVLDLARRIGEAAPDSVIVARTKPDEFALLYREVASRKTLIEMAEALTGVLAFEMRTEVGSVRVGTVVAIAEARVGECTGEALLNNARIALGYRDLPRRPGQVRIFEPEMRAALEARSRTYSELFAALGSDQIEPFFQPQIRLSDRSLVGFEVLVRWRHPAQGLVPPGLFLEIAEATGLLPRIDDIVMRKALACLGRWRAMGAVGLRVSLNCTGHALRDPEFVGRLTETLAEHRLEARHVAIEILETVLFGRAEDRAYETLAALKSGGFRLEIDDFGTGNASISHLIHLDADVVKLDRSLVRDLLMNRSSRLVVEATVALAQKLGLETLAEGVEDDAQMDMLTELGCEYVQGFGIARPMSFDDTSAWLAARGRMPSEASGTSA